MTDIISRQGIKKHLKSTALPVYVFDELDSTNRFARTLADDCALVASDSQTAGRGRLNRRFFSPKGAGVYLSLKVSVPDLYRNIPFITTLASVAVHKSIHHLYNINCGIKWVNDLYVGEKKVSGILCEAPDEGHAIIGIGINVYPSALPDEVKDVATYLAVSSPVTRNELIASIADNILQLVRSLPDTSFMDYYRTHSIVTGKSITCIQADTSFPARAIGISDEGGLIVETEDGIRVLSTGEITIRFTD